MDCRRIVLSKTLRAAAVLALASIAIAACGPKEQLAPAPGSEQTAAPKVVPPAVPVLQIMPEQATAAFVFVSPNRLVAKAKNTMRRFAPDDATADAMVDTTVASLLDNLGFPEVTSLEEFIAATGMNGDAPLSLFCDLTQTQQGSSQPKTPESLEQKAGTPPSPEATGAHEATPEAKEGASDAPAPAEGGDAASDTTPGDAEQPADKPETPASSLPDVILAGEAAAEGAFAVVFECSDPAKATAFIEKGRGPAAGAPTDGPSAGNAPTTGAPETGGASTGAPSATTTTQEDGVTVVHQPDGARYYAATGNRFVVGNSSDMVKAVLAPRAKPIAVRYGTSDCPADPADEIVALIRADKAFPSLFGASQLVTGTPSGSSPQVAKLMDAYKGDDPLVFTLTVDDTRVELLARLDGQTHPGMRGIKGALGPLTQAQVFPDKTLALLSLGFTPERKKALQDVWQGVVPPETQKSPDVAQAFGTAQLVLSSIGNQVTLGIEPGDTALPRIMAAFDLVNPDQTKAFLQTLGLPLEQKEAYSDVEIMASSIPLPLDPPQTVYFAFVQNTLMLSNDLGELKTALDHSRNGSTSSLFASQQPALDPSEPREALLLLKGSALSNVVKPLLGSQGLLDPDTTTGIDKFAQNIQELRYEKALVGTWYEDRLALRFSPAQPSAPTVQ